VRAGKRDERSVKNGEKSAKKGFKHIPFSTKLILQNGGTTVFYFCSGRMTNPAFRYLASKTRSEKIQQCNCFFSYCLIMQYDSQSMASLSAIS
jgi:hypothetical protein